jgi:radical SAM-linked protein
VRQRLRLRYRKDQVLMYVGHRDLLRLTIRLLRRAEVPFATSGKFSPKPRLTFCPALPLGVLADNELLDIELREELNWGAEEVQAAAVRLAKASQPRDFIVALAALPPTALPVSKLVNAARYHLEYDEPPAAVVSALQRADLTVQTAAGKQQDLRSAMLSYDCADRTLTLDGAASGQLNLNITRLADRLAELTGCDPSLIRRQCLLDHSGQPI